MGAYLFNGHKIDILPVIFGFVLYMDDDLTPIEATEGEVLDIISNGQRLSY